MPAGACRGRTSGDVRSGVENGLLSATWIPGEARRVGRCSCMHSQQIGGHEEANGLNTSRFCVRSSGDRALRSRGGDSGLAPYRIMCVSWRTIEHRRRLTGRPSVLATSVFVPNDEQWEYYLPAGRWTLFFHPSRAQSFAKCVRAQIAARASADDAKC